MRKFDLPTLTKITARIINSYKDKRIMHELSVNVKSVCKIRLNSDVYSYLYTPYVNSTRPYYYLIVVEGEVS